MRQKLMWALLAMGLAGCAGRQIYHVRGCDERLGSPEKRMECRACVERPMAHEYLPDNPIGARCARR